MTKPERKGSSGSRKSSDDDREEADSEKKVEKDSPLDDETLSFIGDCLNLVAMSSVDSHIT